MSAMLKKGFASIPLLVFLLVAVTFLMTQTYYSTTARLGNDVGQADSAAAFFVAESGIEVGTAILSVAVDQLEFDAACNTLKSLPDASIGRGTTSYQWQSATSDTDAEISTCTFRATGRVNQAKRTIEKMMEYRVQRGLAGFSEAEAGTSRTTSGTLKVKSSGGTAVAILNSAYRIKGSEGYDDLLVALGLDGNATSSPACGNCSVKWNLESSSGAQSVGSIAVAETLASSDTSLRQQIYTKTGNAESPTPRNYVQVGALVKGPNPNLEGVYAASGDTTNNNATDTSTGLFVTGSVDDKTARASLARGCNAVGGSCACYRSDLLIFAVSGRVNPTNLPAGTYSGSFDSVTFDTDTSGYTGYKFSMQPLVHFPAVDEPTPGAQGDLFAEMWYAFNPYLLANITGVSTVSSSADIALTLTPIASDAPRVNGFVRLFGDCSFSEGSGKTRVTKSCNLPPGAKIKAVEPIGNPVTSYKVTVAKPASFPASPAPSDLTAWTGYWSTSTLCGGICALQPKPSTAGTSASFQIVRNSSASLALRQFAGGFLCLSGVGAAPGTISRQQIATKSWKEITF